MHALAARLRPASAPTRSRGSGRRYRATHSASSFAPSPPFDPSPSLAASNPARAAPTAPVTHSSSPGRPPRRVSTRRGRTLPVSVTSTISGPGERVTLPPASVTLLSRASSKKPSSRACSAAASNDAGSASESSAIRGAAPIAATSDTLTASAFQPTSYGVLKRQSKCTPSTSASVVSTSSAPRSGFATAASSPMPIWSQEGEGWSRAWISAMTWRSPRSEIVALPGVINGPGLADDGNFDLTRVFELVLDAPRDVLRQPHRFLVRDAVALDDDADFTAGLQRERLGHALERVGDVLELLEALHVGLEDIAPGAGPRGGD